MSDALTLSRHDQETLWHSYNPDCKNQPSTVKIAGVITARQPELATQADMSAEISAGLE